MVAALRDEGLAAHAGSGEGVEHIGVWVGDRKIASIGVHVARGVTTHGFAVNVTNDLQPFGWVVPCGLPEVQMTSVLRESAADAADGLFERFADATATAFAAAHGATPVPTPAAAVWDAVPAQA
jgi:lipoyl(octanoyl) transferase